jgi:hypothetical protein
MDTFDNPDHGREIYNGVGIVDQPFTPPKDNQAPLFPSLGESGSDTNDH